MADGGKVIVIGAGVIGLCTAYELAIRGHSVTVIDPGSPSSIRASTLNAGMIVPCHFTPLATPSMLKTAAQLLFERNRPLRLSFRPKTELIKWYFCFLRCCLASGLSEREQVLATMHMSSRKRYLELQEVLSGQFKVTANGLFSFCKSSSTLVHEVNGVDRARALGIRAEAVDRVEIKHREPGLDLEVSGGVHHLDDCHFDPETFMNALTSHLEVLGVQFRWGEKVVRLRHLNRRVDCVETNSQILGADSFVVAMGVWSGQIASQLGFYLPLLGGKGYSFKVPGIESNMRACCLLHEGRVAITPMAGGIRFGGRMEIEIPESRSNPSRQQKSVEGIKNSVRSFLPQFGDAMAGNEPVSVGYRPLTPDGMPAIGRAPNHENLWFGTGHGMMGMSLGPITGQILAQQISEQIPDINTARIPELEEVSAETALRLLAPSRFEDSV